jgi:hypothetical protein
MLHRTCVFACCGICGSCSAFRCVRDEKRDCTIFHSRKGQVQICQKACRDMLCRTCVFPTSGSAGHVVHFDASRARNVIVLFFMFGWDRYRLYKKCVETRYTELVFSSSGIFGSHSAFWYVWGVIHRRTIFYARVGPVRFSQKAHRDTLRQTCVFTSSPIFGPCSAFL